MLRSWRKRLEQALISFVQQAYSLPLERVDFAVPPRIEFGDLSTPVAFDLAKPLRKAPRLIAEDIVNKLGPVEGIRRMEAAGGGYVNVFFDRGLFAYELYNNARRGAAGLVADAPWSGKTIVEHTNINPNKAAHIGHLRNAVIGDTFVRLLRYLGERVEVQNYIDNTGVQVADVVVGFLYLEKKSLAEVQAISGKFDYYCWDLYAKIAEFYAGEAANLALRSRTLRALEAGDNETTELADHISTRITQAHLATMARLGVTYELLPRESDILHLRFWEHAFKLLKERGAIIYAQEGPSAGCWVMRMPEGDEAAGDAEETEKIIVRSDGTVTYVGKDIAYQLWKLGLLGMDFYYRPFMRYPSGQRVWVTLATPCPGETPPSFGGAQRVYNVIDTRQAYLQKVVGQGLRALGFVGQADNSIHFSYERVALSSACAAELGYQTEADANPRATVDVSGRKGQGVKADDLIDKLLEKALTEVQARHDIEATEARRIANQIAVGALRYFLIKYARNSLIAFDFKEALSFEGETGPYLQYTVVRANNIFRKLYEAGDRSADQLTALTTAPLLNGFLEAAPDIWELVAMTARFSDMARLAVQTMEVSHVAKFAFALAQKFNLFYHRHRILSEPDPSRKLFLLAVADLLRTILTGGLELMGMEIPERM
ncbi:MAG: arginine--tRNA ligase [Acidobacteria bacterium]|nr:arginine--tRNA ligase [Acidobacteriota bacterium]MBI3655196.1 arginine--tRNA ligase [Acidobacteriota bacterium]